MCSLDEKRRQFVSGSPQACKNTEQEDAEDLPSCSNSPQDFARRICIPCAWKRRLLSTASVDSWSNMFLVMFPAVSVVRCVRLSVVSFG